MGFQRKQRLWKPFRFLSSDFLNSIGCTAAEDIQRQDDIVPGASPRVTKPKCLKRCSPSSKGRHCLGRRRGLLHSLRNQTDTTHMLEVFSPNPDSSRHFRGAFPIKGCNVSPNNKNLENVCRDVTCDSRGLCENGGECVRIKQVLPPYRPPRPALRGMK